MLYRRFIAIIVFSFAPLLKASAEPATAPGDRDSILAEIKTDQDAIDSITAELKQDEKDAADAEAAADHPPADLTGDRKNAYIDQKKNQAQTAHDAAKDAQERLDEAKKSLEEARAKLAPTTKKSPKN